MKRVLFVLILICSVLSYLSHSEKSNKFELPQGELKWSDVKPQNAKLCAPAAFTDKNGEISGAYRQNWKTYQNGKALNMRVSLKDEDAAYILQSNYPMTLDKFAIECSRYSTNATYLDMGEYGYGYIKKNHLIRPLYIWGFFTRGKQTNWIYIE